MRLTSLLTAFTCLPLALTACPADDTAPGDTETDSGSGTTTTTTTTSTTGTSTDPTSTSSTNDPTNDVTSDDASGGPTSGDVTTSPTGSGSTAATDDAGSGSSGTPACSSVLVTYDLAGSVMNIDAVIDFEIVVQEPYDANLNTGPGTMTLRFAADQEGAPVPGTAQLVEYSLRQDFVTGSPGLATVTTALTGTSGPEECGTATGEFNGTTLAWGAPAEMNPYCVNGMVSCTGTFCGMGGSPPSNMPFVFVDDCTDPHPLDTFTFTNGVESFSSPAIITSMGANQTITMTFAGAAVEREADPATPACACE